MSNKQPTYSEVWETLNHLNLSTLSDKKGNFTYLSWTEAWLTMMTHYPNVQYDFLPETHEDNKTVMCHCIVNIGSLERTMWLPVMDYKNNSVINPTTKQIQDARMRCLVKCFAMFGLGSYIYRGEDLPDPKKDIDEEQAKVPVSETKKYLDGDISPKSQAEKIKHLWPEKWVNDDDFPKWVNNQFSVKLSSNLKKLSDWRDILIEKNATLAVARLDVILTQKGITL